MINSNPLSIIAKTEYKTLAGVRRDVEKLVEEKWSLDEKPPEPPQEKPVSHSLPRVAFLKPKTQN